MLDKCIFLLKRKDVADLTKNIFIYDEVTDAPKKTATHFADADFNLWTTKALFLLQEKTAYTHDDRSVRPFICVKHSGPYLNETDVQRVWILFVDLETMESIHSFELKFEFQTEKASWLSCSDYFQFAQSSPTTFMKSG